MMQKYFLIIGFVLALISCKKRPNPENPIDTTSNCPVVELKYGNIDINLVYNGDKVISEENADGKIEYKYTNDKITKTSVNKNSPADILTWEYVLSGSKIVSAKEINSNPQLNKSSEYFYNSENQLVTINNVDGLFKTFITVEYTNGNVTKITNKVTTDANPGTLIAEQPFVYTSEKYIDTDGFMHPFYLSVYPLGAFSDHYLLEYGYFGANPKNMIRSYRDDNYTYTKNSAGKISSVAANGITVNFIRRCN